METKTKQAKTLLDAGDIKGCLKLVKGFRIGLTPAQQRKLSTGYEALVHPAFYMQLKKDPKVLVADALEVLPLLFIEKL